MDWYTLLASERHDELMREAESFNRVRQAQEDMGVGTSLADRALIAFGRWMVSSGKRLQARRQVCVDTISARSIAQTISHHS